MGYVQYSPWLDAAAYGRGMGETLSQGMLQQPQQRAQAAVLMAQVQAAQQQQRIQQQRAPLEDDLLRAQIQNVSSRPEYMQALLDQKQQTLNMQQQLGESLARQRDAEAAWNLYRAQGGGAHGGNPMMNLATVANAARHNAMGLGPTAGVLDGQSVSTDPATLAILSQAPDQPTLYGLLEQAQLRQNITTNAPAVPHWYGDKPAQTTTNWVQQLPPELVAQFGVVPTGKLPNASIPQMSTGQTNAPAMGAGATPITATGPNGQKLQLINGQWTPIQ